MTGWTKLLGIGAAAAGALLAAAAVKKYSKRKEPEWEEYPPCRSPRTKRMRA